VKEVKNANYLYCFFRNRFASPRNGDSPSLSVESKTMKENAQLEPEGAKVNYRPDHGPLTAWYNWRTIFSQQ
jgi:hypothetical protein